jgi:hypothetical protein
MSSGAHSHDLSGAHVQDQLFYNLGPYGVSVTVIFIYVGKDQFYLFFYPTSLLVGTGVLEDENNMTFKIPAGFSATFRLIEVATGATAGDEGKYLVTMQLHPSTGDDKMKDLDDEMRARVIEIRRQNMDKLQTDPPLPAGICPGNEACPGTHGPCQLGQILNDECKCVDP